MDNRKETGVGAAAALASYVLWGILPIYWKWVVGPSALEILAHRILWSFLFMLILLAATKQLGKLGGEARTLVASPKRLLLIIGASLSVTVNWYVFIWSVGHGHVVQASLGYYINPLVSVLLGVMFLKERLTAGQIVSFFLALTGVLIMVAHTGAFPWISLTLAFTFGLYGLLKKSVHLQAGTGLAIETSILSLPAAAYLLLSEPSAGSGLFSGDPRLILLLIGAGPITAIPLLLFASGANRISLTMVGFFQYICPSLMLILGTLMYHEPFDAGNLWAFVLIWLSLALFSLSRFWKPGTRRKHKSLPANTPS